MLMEIIRGVLNICRGNSDTLTQITPPSNYIHKNTSSNALCGSRPHTATFTSITRQPCDDPVLASAQNQVMRFMRWQRISTNEERGHLDQPATQSITQFTSQFTSQCTSQSTSQSTTRFTSQTTKQSTSQSTTQSTRQPTSQSTNQSTSQPPSPPYKLQATQSANQLPSKPSNQSTDQ